MARHLLVTNDFPPKTGGIQVYLYELWRRLEPGRAVVLTASSHADAPAFDAADHGVVVERVRSSTLYLPTRRVLRAIEAAIERHQPDLVLLDPVWPLGLLGPRLSRPYGVVLHGAEVTIPARLPLIKSSLRHVLERASVVVCAGSYPAAEVKRAVGPRLAPVLLVPPGVDTSRFVPLDSDERRAARRELNCDDEDFLIVSYSRLVPRKGMDTLIRAAAALAPLAPRVRVVIAGAGRDRARLVRLATRLAAPVSFLGRTSDETHPRFIAAGDLMVLDCRSRWWGLEQEGFGIVFLEAAACAVAQVAGRSGGSGDAVEHGVTGLVVNSPRSVAGLAAAIENVMNDDVRRREFGRRGREMVESRFAWDILATQLSHGLAAFDHFNVSTPPTYGGAEEVE